MMYRSWLASLALVLMLVVAATGRDWQARRGGYAIRSLAAADLPLGLFAADAPRRAAGLPGRSVASPEMRGDRRTRPAADGAVYNVRDPAFQGGARGDGAADDTRAIQAAIQRASATGARGAGEAIVYLPPGTYRTTATLTVPGYVRITGSGYSTQIKPTPGPVPYDVFRITAAGANGILFADFLIDGDGADAAWAGAACHGIHFAAVTSAAVYNTLRNVLIKEMSGSGVRLAGVGVEQLIIQGCVIRDCYGSGIYSTNSVDVLVTGNILRAAKSGAHGIYLSGSNSWVIDGNHISDCGGEGVKIEGATTRVKVRGNHLRGNASCGVAVLGGSSIDVSGNTCDQNGLYGIYADTGASYLAIADNEVRSSGRTGILLGTVSHSRVAGNLVHGNNLSGTAGHDGIALAGSGDNLVSGNIVRQDGGKQEYGLRVAGAGNTIRGNDLTASGSAGSLSGTGSANLIAENRGYVTENNALSEPISVYGAAPYSRTVTIAHGLSCTPGVEDCQVSIVGDGVHDDWSGSHVVVSADATHVTCRVRVTTSSASRAATARLSLHVNRRG